MEDDLGLGTIPVTGDLYIKWGSHFIKTNKTGQEVADQVQSLQDRIKELEGAMREVYEVWAGSEGLVESTAPEAYQSNMIREMRDIAGRHLPTPRGNKNDTMD